MSLSLLKSRIQSKTLLKGVVVAFVLLLSLTVLIPLAHAASFTYVNNVSTLEYHERSSSLRASITGGTARNKTLSVGSTTVATYYAKPGYRVLFSATGTSPFAAVMGHLKVTNAYSKCWWSYHGAGGSSKLSCTVSS